MSRFRWKLTAGGLILGLGGIAALADGPVRIGISGCSGDSPKHHADNSTPLVSAPPVALPGQPPAPASLIPQPPVDLSPPAMPEVQPSSPANVPSPAVIPTIESSPAIPSMPLLPAASEAKIRLPKVESTPEPLSLPPTPIAVKEAASSTPPALSNLPDLPQPSSGSAGGISLPTVPDSDRRQVPNSTSGPPPQPVQDVQQTLQPTPLPNRVSNQKKLSVVLHLGDDRPRFEVRDGDEIYLKVICESVEVKSPSDSGDVISILKASGHVRFITPGGEGTCKELMLIPGSGQVDVMGQVSFKHNWGTAETVVTGEKMTFRLGKMASTTATQGTMPASFSERR